MSLESHIMWTFYIQKHVHACAISCKIKVKKTRNLLNLGIGFYFYSDKLWWVITFYGPPPSRHPSVYVHPPSDPYTYPTQCDVEPSSLTSHSLLVCSLHQLPPVGRQTPVGWCQTLCPVPGAFCRWAVPKQNQSYAVIVSTNIQLTFMWQSYTMWALHSYLLQVVYFLVFLVQFD